VAQKSSQPPGRTSGLAASGSACSLARHTSGSSSPSCRLKGGGIGGFGQAPEHRRSLPSASKRRALSFPSAQEGGPEHEASMLVRREAHGRLRPKGALSMLALLALGEHEGIDDFGLEMRGGQREHGLALVVEDARLGATGQQQLHHLVAAARRRVEERRLAVAVPGC